MRIRSDAPTSAPIAGSQEAQPTTTPEKAKESPQAELYKDRFEAFKEGRLPPGLTEAKSHARGFKVTSGMELKPAESDLAARREQAVDEIGRGHIEHEVAYQNFKTTAQNIYAKEGAEGVERFRKDIDAGLKKNFGPESSLEFEMRKLENGAVFLDIEQTRPHPEGGMNRISGGLVLSD